jgi:microcystin-dependent protein
MSNLPQQDTIVQYLADGVTTNYVVPFYTPLEPDGTPDLDVYTQLNTAPAVPSSDINIWNVAYIYTPNLDPTTGGIITFLPGYIPPDNYVVTIVRDVSASLDVEFSQASTFSGYTLDAALDKLLLISQQNKSYALDRNLSYVVNSYLPEAVLEANVQIPVLQSGQIWYGSVNGVIAVTLEQSADTSTLRSELANNSPGTDGARLVGYYDPVALNPTTVDAQLTLLTESVESALPPGFIIPYGGASAPSGYLLCNGAAVSRATYANLFGVIGTSFGIGDGSTTFNVPNTQGKILGGAGGALISGANTVGATGGANTITLNANNLPAHTHPSSANIGTNVVNVPSGSTFGVAVAGVATGINTTTNTPFSIVPPTLLVNYIIKT